MDILNIKNITKICNLVIAAVIISSCAKLIPAAPRAEEVQQPNSGSGGGSSGGSNKPVAGGDNAALLAGEFKSSTGEAVSLQNLSKDMPIILFFAGEFCSACREETNNLLSLFKEKGLPTKVRLVTILVGSNYQDITGWIETFENHKIEWVVGADDDSLSLYKKYFTKLVTPSILFYDPQAKLTKKWQDKISIEKLEMETTPWY